MPDALPRQFATTRWSLVLAAGEQGDSAESKSAMETLCRAYWYPLYAFVRRRGHAPQALAQDDRRPPDRGDHHLAQEPELAWKQGGACGRSSARPSPL